MNISRNHKSIWRFAFIWGALSALIMLPIGDRYPWIGVLLVCIGSGVLIWKEFSKVYMTSICVKPVDSQCTTITQTKWQFASRNRFIRLAAAAGIVSVPVAGPFFVVRTMEPEPGLYHQPPTEPNILQNSVVLAEESTEQAELRRRSGFVRIEYSHDSRT
jgi:hypothetical protein